MDSSDSSGRAEGREDRNGDRSGAHPSRRDFVRILGGVGAAAVTGGAAWAMVADDEGTAAVGALQSARHPLATASELAPSGITLRAAPGSWDMGSRVTEGWLLNGSAPSPLIRVRRGDAFRVTMENELPEPFILHWHGLKPPEAMDGHPRLAVDTGETYEYEFRVDDRAGIYWYHSHADRRTAVHTYRGVGGLILVEDPDEPAELPPREREVPLILQDRLLDAEGRPAYPGMGPSRMVGVMGEEPFANGTHRAYHDVEAAVHRLLIVNGAVTRIFRLGRSDGRPLVLIGGDRGLLERPVSLPFVELGPGERADLLLDLSTASPGDRVVLRSLEFTVPGGMGGMGGGRGGGGRGGGRGGAGGGPGGMMGMMAAADLQGRPMDLLELRVGRRPADSGTVPTALPSDPTGYTLPDPARAEGERRFVFTSAMMSHRINGRSFQMDRVDERVPFGRTEIWSFVNDSALPHPVHLHATHFRVLDRQGGRGRVFPWEEGPKDTVLVYPGETVRAAVRFVAQRGLFLLHCHNLVHEDGGMMQNILVE